ncbi:MAG: 5-(carboxyamino)imidazole ribonucleotide mutase [candidate division WOR-3 bacterium]|jgi:5-(carboxyamino)imidazole ribonucleotide mutase
MSKILIIMGSGTDLDYSKKIESTLKKFEIECELRVASAHKTPEKVKKIIEENKEKEVVYITVAGRSNALSGFVDANTNKPVIASPPYSDKFGGADIFSSLRMPSGVAPMVVLGAEQAALAAVKIVAFANKELQTRISEYQELYKQKIEKEDKEING